LNSAVQQVSKAISSRTTAPILSGIKIEAYDFGVKLTASDADLSIESFIPAEIERKIVIKVTKTGSIVVPAKFFIEMIRKLSSDDVSLEVNERLQLNIKSGSTDIVLACMDAEEYPIMPRLSETNMMSISNHLLQHMVRQVVFAVSTNESTPVLTGVLWTLSEETLKLVATDRHRLAKISNKVTGSNFEFSNIVISGKNLNELLKVLPEEDEIVDIIISENQVLFRVNQLLIYSRTLDGTFPDTSKIIPQNFKTEISFDTKKLADAIDRAYVLSREDKSNIVKIITETDGSNQVEISSTSTELGKVTEWIDFEKFSGEALRISFNSKYILEVLKIINSKYIHIGFTGAMSPMVLRPQTGYDTLHLILPYRTAT
jgi:DNA polymerase-3 subunit beta